MNKTPLHALLLPASQVLFLVAYNINEVEARSAIILTLGMSIAFGGVLFLLWFFTRDPLKSGLIASLLSVLFFSYGRVHAAVPVLQIGGVVVGKSKYLLCLYLAALVGGIVLIARSRRPARLAAATRFANAAAVAFLLMTLVVGVYRFDPASRSAAPPLQAAGDQPSALTGGQADPDGPGTTQPRAAAAKLPDIYYIVLDSYTSSSVLKEYYSYDDSVFIGELSSLGFFVSHGSRSNYPFTTLSLAASMNMSYVHEEIDYTRMKQGSAYLSRRLGSSLVVQSLADLGYTTYGYDTWWEPAYADGSMVSASVKKSLFSDALMLALVKTSMLVVIDDELTMDQQRSDILAMLADLPKASERTTPFFVFAHILCPHPPYVFRADGSRPGIIESAAGRVDHRNGYVAQVQFIGQTILSAIRNVRAADDPIIVLQADHGHGLVLGDHTLDRVIPSKEFLEARFGILSAYYFPRGLDVKVYDGISPVNSFRIILNALYGQAVYPLLEDRSIFTSMTEPWKFSDVTDLMGVHDGSTTDR